MEAGPHYLLCTEGLDAPIGHPSRGSRRCWNRAREGRSKKDRAMGFISTPTVETPALYDTSPDQELDPLRGGIEANGRARHPTRERSIAVSHDLAKQTEDDMTRA